MDHVLGRRLNQGLRVAIHWYVARHMHVLLFCLEREQGRHKILETTETNDCDSLLETNAGLKVGSKWLMSSDLLGRYHLTREHLHGT